MLKDYNMIGSTKEDLEMNQIIKDNQSRIRMELNEKNKKNKLRNRLNKIENFIIYLIFGIMSGLSMFGIMFLISIIENMKF